MARLGTFAGMENHNDELLNEASNDAIEQFIASAIQKGTFSPTVNAHLQQSSLQASKLPAASPNANQPAPLEAAALSAGDSVEILTYTPLEIHRYFLSQGYYCVTSITANEKSHHSALKETYSWDQQLILSIWHCLETFEGFSKPSPQPMSSSRRSQDPLPECLKTTAHLSPQKRLEHLTKHVIFHGLKVAPIAIFIDSLEPFEHIPNALETLFTWIWQCYQQLEQQTGCHPLRFVVLGKVVT